MSEWKKKKEKKKSCPVCVIMCCVGSERYVRLSPPFPDVNMMNVDKLFRFRQHYCNDVSAPTMVSFRAPAFYSEINVKWAPASIYLRLDLTAHSGD